MTRLLYFDVDGTIVNSRELVTKAYEAVGVKMPAYAWGLRWQDWLVDHCEGADELARLLHERKSHEYVKLLTRSDIQRYALPAAQLARHALLNYGVNSVRYLTASTDSTAYSIVSRLGIAATLTGNLSYDQRRDVLADAPTGTVYLDDNEETLDQLKRDLPNLATIHINGQSFDELLVQVRSLT